MVEDRARGNLARHCLTKADSIGLFKTFEIDAILKLSNNLASWGEHLASFGINSIVDDNPRLAFVYFLSDFNIGKSIILRLIKNLSFRQLYTLSVMVFKLFKMTTVLYDFRNPIQDKHSYF